MSRTNKQAQVFPRLVNQELAAAAKKRKCLILDLFAGCGGMSLGFEAAGFQTVGFELNEDCCRTFRHNLRSPCHRVRLKVGQKLCKGADAIIAGPPCQPFSVSGYQNGEIDDRDGFPSFLWAVENYRPQLALCENVRGMLFQNRPYLDAIVRRLKELGYQVEWKLLNAADYGVPQKRERLFVVAHHGGFRFPCPTHSGNPVTAGEALDDLLHSMPENAKFLTPRMDRYVARYEKASACARPRDLHLERPSRTVTCRNLSGATGDMLRIRLPNGRRRQLTVREGARLQSFPDWFRFFGAETSQFGQIGNAVPPLMAKSLAVAVCDYLQGQAKPMCALQSPKHRRAA